MKRLTERQGKVLEMIMETVEARGFPPSTREIKECFGFGALKSAIYHLDALETKGYIKRDPSSARSIRVLADWHGERVALSYTQVAR